MVLSGLKIEATEFYPLQDCNGIMIYSIKVILCYQKETIIFSLQVLKIYYWSLGLFSGTFTFCGKDLNGVGPGLTFFTFCFSIVNSSAAPSASPCSQAWSGAHPTARREWNWIPFGGGCKRWSGPWIQTTSSNHNGRPHWVIEGIEIISKTWTSAAAPQPGRWNKKIWLLCDLTLTWGYFLELSLLVTIRSHPIPSIASFSGCPNRNTNCSLVCLQLVPCSTFLKFALALHLSVMFRCLSGETM